MIAIPRKAIDMNSIFLRTITSLCIFVLVCACSSNPTTEPSITPPGAVTLPASIEDAVASDLRTPENKKRDVYRHPTETLGFFGLRPEMTVVEILPSAGWYAEIIAPFVAAKGRYYGAVPKGKEDPKLVAWLDRNPGIAAKVSFVDFAPGADLVAPGTADLVVTFRNVHNWMMKGSEKSAFESFFKALKPGGKLGVVEHRAPTKWKDDKQGKSGYVREATVIKLAEAAGFKLVGKSEINSNPKDTKGYPDGVWTLPPSFKLGSKNRELYAAIGESDRMTLKFAKPD